MTTHFSEVVDNSRSSAIARTQVCLELNQLLVDAAKLWGPAELTTKWQDILCDGSIIQRADSPRRAGDKRASSSGTSYRLLLRAATPEAMFMVACCPPPGRPVAGLGAH